METVLVGEEEFGRAGLELRCPKEEISQRHSGKAAKY